MTGALDHFSPATRAWFENGFDAPTAAQEQGWASIARGEHTLVLAPTGSGKTLAAFLWAIDQLITSPRPPEDKQRCRILYISPLKALGYDIERNLAAPLQGIAIQADKLGVEVPEIRVATRTGDTPPAERRALAKYPPDVLITTPESLYLLLTSNAREILTSVEHVIIDEIHAVAATKRGAHLAVSLERLERLVRQAREAKGLDANPTFQRVGLSATQRPLDVLARFLGGRAPDVSNDERPWRPVTIVDAGVRKTLDLEVIVPVEDLSAIGKPLQNPNDGEFVLSGSAAGTPEVRSSIWPAIHPVLLELIRTHTSTLVFVNSRRLAERLAAQLNELALEDDELVRRTNGGELVRAHHGSVAREHRREIEDALKGGRLPALVATSSLELGIDMGAIDLVVQVEAPPSVASGLQRVGRAGHQVGAASKGRMFPKYRGDLLTAAVVTQRMQIGAVEETRIIRNPVDVLAQQIVAMVAAEEHGMLVDDIVEVVGGCANFAELTRELFENTLDMLAGRYPSDEFAELRPRVNWDRVVGRITARQGAKMLALTSGGTIPDRGLFGVFTPEGSRVGELDEEMVYECRVGETFLLGASTWRIEDITRDRVVVTPAPGEPGKMPFWHGDQLGRPYELGRAIGKFLGDFDSFTDEMLHADSCLDPLAIKNLRAYINDEREATGGVLPTDKQIVVERFRDELGDWRLCILSPFGAQVHAPWALAIEANVREKFGLELQTIWSDDGIVLRLPEAEDEPPLDYAVIDPDDLDRLIVDQTGRSALFAARFRENAARALLLPRRRPGQRTPLWQMRQRAADLLGVASQYAEFPIILETFRECLRDVFDVSALHSILGDIRSRKIRVVSVETQIPSPFAASLVFGYVASFMYEGDAPLAERRAQALTLDRRMLSELVGDDELRDLVDVEALASLELELQFLVDDRRVSTLDTAHDLLVRLGDLTEEELDARTTEPFGVELLRARRAVVVRIAGEDRFIAVEDAGRYRDALGVTPPLGIPDVFLTTAPDALTQVVRRWARTHGPFVPVEPAARFGIPPDVVEALLRSLELDGRVVHGGFRPDGIDREWVDVDVLGRLRRRSLAALRKEVEPVTPDALVRFLPVWQGVGADTRGVERVVEVLAQLEGLPVPASIFEPDVLSSRVRDYRASHLDELMASGEFVWVGTSPIGRDDGRIMVMARAAAPGLLTALGWSSSGAPGAERPQTDSHQRVRALLHDRGACFFRELSSGADEAATLDALWDLVWTGEVTNDGYTSLRAFLGRKATVAGARGRAVGVGSRPRIGRRLNALTVVGPPKAQGRWSLVERELLVGVPSPTECLHALAGSLLERHGVLTREAVRGEGVIGGFARVYPVLRALEDAGRIRRGYAVAGLGGAQFALPGAIDRLRTFREPSTNEAPATVVLAACDPANPHGGTLPWPQIDGVNPRRVPGAFVAFVDGQASLYLEKGGRTVSPLREFDGTWEFHAVGALVTLVDSGRVARLTLTKFSDELRDAFNAHSFVPSPKGLARYPRS